MTFDQKFQLVTYLVKNDVQFEEQKLTRKQVADLVERDLGFKITDQSIGNLLRRDWPDSIPLISWNGKYKKGVRAVETKKNDRAKTLAHAVANLYDVLEIPYTDDLKIILGKNSEK